MVDVLHDREVVVVPSGRRHRRSHHAGGARAVEDDAALSERPEFGMVELTEPGNGNSWYSRFRLAPSGVSSGIRPSDGKVMREVRGSPSTLATRSPTIIVDLVVTSADRAGHRRWPALRVTRVGPGLDRGPLSAFDFIDLGLRVDRTEPRLRSNGVSVALLQLPWRSGWPHSVLGGCQSGSDRWASPESAPRREEKNPETKRDRVAKLTLARSSFPPVG